jgi:type II secretory pathway component PulK
LLAIATVALQFALVARERRELGLISADGGRQRAAAGGALAMVQAQMDYDLRNNGAASGRPNLAGLQSSDPWFGADSTYSGTYYVDTMPVQVVAKDLGTMINVNNATLAQMQTLFNFVLGDAATANLLASAIIDWRDVDDLARPGGAEKDDYIKANMLTLPSNAPFREVEDLINVMGMTWDELNLLYPYLTTHGPSGGGVARININAAPEPVLRALPGMTDAILTQILALRSQGRRITSVAQVMAGTPQGRQVTATVGRGGATNVQVTQTQTALTAATTVDTQNVELTFYVQGPANVQPTRLTALMTRTNNQATISWQLLW